MSEDAGHMGGLRIGSIVIHCHQFDRMVAFWQEALDYVPRAPARGGWVVLRDPAGRGPNLSFQAREAPAKARSWLHLDLYAEDRDGEVARLTSPGGRGGIRGDTGPARIYVVRADVRRSCGLTSDCDSSL